jgi:hypothetical protein
LQTGGAAKVPVQMALAAYLEDFPACASNMYRWQTTVDQNPFASTIVFARRRQHVLPDSGRWRWNHWHKFIPA